MTVRVAPVALALSLVLEVSCLARSVFTCATDDECRTDDAQGMCQADGYCSFPDDGCDSGQRYGAHAGDGKGNQCVSNDDASVTSETGSADVDTGATSSESTTNVDSAGSSSSGTTLEGTSTGNVAEESSTGTVEPPSCSFEDEFEGDEIDPSWELFGTLSLEQSDGLLHIPLVSAAGTNNGGIRRDGEDLDASVVAILVGSGPNPSTSAELQINFAGGGNGMRLTLTNGGAILYGFVDDDTLTLTSEPHDIEQYAWLRFVFDESWTRVQYSEGGNEWVSLWEGRTPIELGNVTASLSARTWELVENPGTVSFDRFSICPLP